MEFEKLYQFVHGLSVREKKNFTRFTSGKKGDTLPIVLYKRILASNDLDEESLKKIKGNEFKNLATFCNNRNELLKLLIQSLVHYKSRSLSTIPFIKQAFLYEATKLAEDAIIKEMHKAEKTEDFSLMIRLYELIEELNRFYGFSINLQESLFPYPDTLAFSYPDALAELSTKLRLNAYIDEIGEAAKESLTRQFAVANRLERLIAPTYGSKTNNHLRTKILTNLSFLKRDLDSAFSFGQTFIEMIKGWPEKYPPIMISMELSKIALQAAALLEREQSMKYLLQMSALSGDSPYSASQIKKSRLITGATIAAVFAIAPLAESCFDELQQIPELFPERLIPKLYHNLGMAFFYNDDFSNAIKCFQIERNNLKRTYPFLKWEPQVLLAISLFELGDHDQVESLIRSAEYAAEAIPHRYPSKAINVIGRYCLCQGENSVPTLNDLHEIGDILTAKEEKKASQDFSVDIWIESKVKSIAQKQILQARLERARVEIQKLPKLN